MFDVSYYVQAPWPVPQLQIDRIDQELTVSTWLDTVLGPANWAWATGPRDRICVFVSKPEYVTLIKLHYAH